jgi:outer membrane immunogenic protein
MWKGMRIVNRILKLGAAAVALAIGSTAALAADIGAPAPPYDPPPTYNTSAYNWTGPYAGGLLGYGWANFSDGMGTTGRGWLAGGYLGFNIQTPGNWVYGIEGDAMWSGIGGSNGNTDSLRYLTTLRGRAGYAFGDYLIYGTGGLAVAGGTTYNGVSSASATHIGWTAGAGIEAALSQNITGRIEYDYVRLNGRTYGNGINARRASSRSASALGSESFRPRRGMKAAVPSAAYFPRSRVSG